MGPKKAQKSSAHACNRCRAAKLRCLVDTIGEHGKCRRCYNGDKECVFDNLATRSRRERLDTRVRYLEQEVKSLRALVGSSPQDSRSEMIQSPESSSGGRPVSSKDAPGRPSIRSPTSDSDRGSTAVEQHNTVETWVPFALVSHQQFEHLFNVFITQSLPHYPILALENGLTVHAMSQAKPVLTFAMVTAAARASEPALFRQLHSQLSKLLSEKIVINGERNMELLQAVLVAEVWYDPPDDLNRLNFYMWLQIAASMAQQLGLWWDTNTVEAITRNKASGAQLENWRTAIAVYLCSSTVSVSLQRPISMTLPPPARTALAKYTVNATHANDRRLAAWMTLQIISEGIEELRLRIGDYDRHNSSFETVWDDLDGRLTLYEQVSTLNDALHVHYCYVRCKYYELGVTHYMSGDSQENGLHGNPMSLNCTNYERAIISLIKSCHEMVGLVVRMPVSEYLHCPTVTTVRALYAVRTLLLLRYRYVHSASDGKGVSLCCIIDSQRNLDCLERFLTRAKDSVEHRIPVMALKIMQTICRYGAQSIDPAHPLRMIRSQAGSNDLDTVTSSTLRDAEDVQITDLSIRHSTNYPSANVRHACADIQNSLPIAVSSELDPSHSPDDLAPLDAAFWSMFNAQIRSSDSMWSADSYQYS